MSHAEKSFLRRIACVGGVDRPSPAAAARGRVVSHPPPIDSGQRPRAVRDRCSPELPIPAREFNPHSVLYAPLIAARIYQLNMHCLGFRS